MEEVPQKEEEDKLEVPHLIGNLIELIADTKTSMAEYKTSLEDTIEESKTSLSEEIIDAKDSLEDTIRESKVSIEKTVNFLENTLTESKTLLDEEIRNGKTEIVDALAQSHSSIENIEEMTQKNHELLESLTDKMDSQDLANVTKNVLEVSWAKVVLSSSLDSIVASCATVLTSSSVKSSSCAPVKKSCCSWARASVLPLLR